MGLAVCETWKPKSRGEAMREMTQQEALAVFEREAKKRGISVQEFIDTEVRRVLEKVWEIQQRTGKAVPFKQLHRELNQG